jgi:putative hydrolase
VPCSSQRLRDYGGGYEPAQVGWPVDHISILPQRAAVWARLLDGLAAGLTVNPPPFGFRPPGDEPDPDRPEQPEPGAEGQPEQPEPGAEGQPEQPEPGAEGLPDNPFAAMFGGGSAQDLGALFQRLGQLMSSDTGPVNWELAKDTARRVTAERGDPLVTDRDQREIAEAMQLAEHWLDPVTSLPAGTTGAEAWQRANWIDETLPTWQRLVDPIAGQMSATMGQVLPQEMQQTAGPLLAMMRQMGGVLFGMQAGQGLGELAGEVVSSTDVGFPLVPGGRAALLPAGVAAFGAGLNLPREEVRLYLALREAAHQRLYAHVPWLRGHLESAIEAYAKGIRIDARRLEDLVGSMDPTDPAALQDALASGMFEPETTPEQEAALTRLETALALVEGWVDEVVDAAAADRLPSAAALRETVRRRRATGGPAEETFATLVGLELRPRRLREAATLWRALADERGIDGRDAVWGHPDLMPTTADLDDPKGFVQRADLDLSELDNEPPAPPEPPEPPTPPPGG